jgi:hypothetical protein
MKKISIEKATRIKADLAGDMTQAMIAKKHRIAPVILSRVIIPPSLLDCLRL